MKTHSMLLTALASAPVALAHTAFTDFYVDGTAQVCMESHENVSNANAFRVMVLPCV